MFSTNSPLPKNELYLHHCFSISLNFLLLFMDQALTKFRGHLKQQKERAFYKMLFSQMGKF